MRHWMLPLAGVLSAATLLAAAQVADTPLHQQARRLMGTFCEVKVYDDDPVRAERAMTAALDEMARVDRLLSNYDPASELSAMNREAGRVPFRASPELLAFVSTCRRYHGLTERAFDPTVGPLVRAWGFFGKSPARPTDEAIAAAKRDCGFDKVVIDEAAGTVAFSRPGLQIDPGGIGKGYAVDLAVKTLRDAGISSALVSAGGSTLYGIGHPPGQAGWRVAVANPAEAGRALAFVSLRDASLSTSGVLRQFVVDRGRRYSHVFDPRSGEPVEGMCQVTVVAPTATASDALTKAAFVLPRDAVARILGSQAGVHALRLEGACDAAADPWVTPWSSGVFEHGSPGR